MVESRAVRQIAGVDVVANSRALLPLHHISPDFFAPKYLNMGKWKGKRKKEAVEFSLFSPTLVVSPLLLFVSFPRLSLPLILCGGCCSDPSSFCFQGKVERDGGRKEEIKIMLHVSNRGSRGESKKNPHLRLLPPPLGAMHGGSVRCGIGRGWNDGAILFLQGGGGEEKREMIPLLQFAGGTRSGERAHEERKRKKTKPSCSHPQFQCIRE